jgi:hypothetical protein
MAASKPRAMHNVAIVNLLNVLKLPVLTSFIGAVEIWAKFAYSYIFGDESESENFAFSMDRHGASIPPIKPQTEWVFLEAINTLKIPGACDGDDLPRVVEHLKADGV